jgi:SAM-dependent MidA family methyltransferase
VAWRAAARAFYGSAAGRAEDHFATAVTDSRRTAERIHDIIAVPVVDLLEHAPEVTITDVGAGNGRLLHQVKALWEPQTSARIRWRGIDLRERPHDLDPVIEWITADVHDLADRLEPGPGVVIAHELLDDIACAIAEVGDDGRLRMVDVDPRTGLESLGDELPDDPWTAAWWPRREPAARVEIGHSRDEAWRSITGLIDNGVAIAIDYGHVAVERTAGIWDAGTLTAFCEGRLVRVVPDGTCNITAHVAVDACAAAVEAASTRLERSDDGLWWLVQQMAR